MRGLFLSCALVAIFVLPEEQAVAFESKALGIEMSALTRSMDVLLAREEMKGTLSSAMVGSALRSLAGDLSPEVTEKMNSISDSSSLSQCLTKHDEKKAPNGDTTEVFIEYAGPNCPLLLRANFKVVASGSGMSGGGLLEFSILSPALKAQFDIEELRMPIHLDVSMGPSPDGGFAILMKFDSKGEMKSTKWGPVSYQSDGKSTMSFGAGLSATTETQEIYSGGGSTQKFVQTSKVDNLSNVETFSVNDVVVTKEEFTKLHQAVLIPGFSQDKVALAQPHSCLINAYDSSRYTLDQIRSAIKVKTINSIAANESLPIPLFSETGTIEIETQFFDQPVVLEVGVTQDVVRFKFTKQDKTELGTMTALLEDHADITKVIGNRVVRIVCDPK